MAGLDSLTHTNNDNARTSRYGESIGLYTYLPIKTTPKQVSILFLFLLYSLYHFVFENDTSTESRHFWLV